MLNELSVLNEITPRSRCISDGNDTYSTLARHSTLDMPPWTVTLRRLSITARKYLIVPLSGMMKKAMVFHSCLIM